MGAIQDRLNLFLLSKDISAQAFERKSNISVGTASRLSDKSYATTFNRIAKAFPELNIHWLRTGEGQMLNSSNNITVNGHKNVGKVEGSVDYREGTFYDACPDEGLRNQLLEEKIAHLTNTIKEKDARIEELKSSNADLRSVINIYKSRIEELESQLNR